MDEAIERVAKAVVDCAFHLHSELGPGLLESVYETLLADELERRGFTVRRQVPVPIVFRGRQFEEGFRADLIVDERVLIELKSIQSLTPVHPKQVLTYLRMLNLRLGLLINFGASTFREGIRRIAN